jgi:glutathione synthase/RimK-type ligase-like ATP-grasp enzyme
MILICGNSFDPTIMFLRARWHSDGLGYRVLDLAHGKGKGVIRMDHKGSLVNGSIAGANWRLEAQELSGVFFRNHRCRPEKGANSSYPECEPNLAALLNNLPCKVANRPAAAMSNRSKPFQALQISKCGFAIPETLVTNSPEAVRQFYEERDEKVIIKSISGVRSIVRMLSPQHLERLPLLRNGPAQFQAYIAGDDIRVHVVGNECFATRIVCSSVDYRFAWQEGISIKMEPTVLNAEVASRCLQLTEKLGLTLAGIDLKESPVGEYYCFEVNAAPVFPFYERITHQPVSKALGEFLRQP